MSFADAAPAKGGSPHDLKYFSMCNSCDLQWAFDVLYMYYD
jgi:hypothetical protein